MPREVLIEVNSRFFASQVFRIYEDERNRIVQRAAAGEDISSDIRGVAEGTVLWPTFGAASDSRLAEQGAVVKDIQRAVQDARVERLMRLGMSGLADMPREVRLAAQASLAEAHQLAGNRGAYRSEEPALRAEEERLRNAVMQKQATLEANRQQGIAAQQREATRAQILAQCNIRAAVAGASVPMPYVRGRAGVLGAAIAGALDQTLTEERVRLACLSAAGF